MGIKINHYKDFYEIITSMMECRRFFCRGNSLDAKKWLVLGIFKSAKLQNSLHHQ